MWNVCILVTLKTTKRLKENGINQRFQKSSFNFSQSKSLTLCNNQRQEEKKKEDTNNRKCLIYVYKYF